MRSSFSSASREQGDIDEAPRPASRTRRRRPAPRPARSCGVRAGPAGGRTWRRDGAARFPCPCRGASTNTRSIRPCRPATASGSEGERTCRLRRPGALAARDDLRQALGVGVIGIELAGVGHGGGQGQGLAAAAGAEIEHLAALDLAGGRGGDLGAQILHLEPALGEDRSRSPPPPPARAAWGAAMRRALAITSEGAAPMASSACSTRPASPFRVLGAQVHWRAAGQGRPLRRPLLAEHTRQVRVQPVGIVAANGGGRIVERLGLGQAPRLLRRQRPGTVRSACRRLRHPGRRSSPRRSAGWPARPRAGCRRPASTAGSGDGAGRPAPGRRPRRGPWSPH